MAQTHAKKGRFKTRLRHRTLGAILRGARPPSPGHRPRPVVIHLDPEPGVTPSPAATVRIFVASEPAQYRAERVYLWSILQVRDPARAYEIHLMKDLQGFDRTGWKTGFTLYRYAVPHLAGGSGRAIYNDVDQVYFTDPAELFDTDMRGAGVLSIDERETSVMLLDCEKMAATWPLEDAQRGNKHKHFRALAHDAGLWSTMSPLWNARDDEFEEGRSKLLHFTTLQTQPWRPFPGEFRYRSSRQAEVWRELEAAADAAGFTGFTRERQSPRFRELISLYQAAHGAAATEGTQRSGKDFRGVSLAPHVAAIARLASETGARTLLDYGSGKATLYSDDPDHEPGSRHKILDAWPGVRVTCYDPGHAPFSGPFEDAYDGVIATDVLEHIPEEDIQWVLDELFRHARHFVYAVATCYPAKKVLPDGTNAHCTVMLPAWWRGQMELAARRHPGVRWVLCTKERSHLSLRKRKGLLKKGVRFRYFGAAS